ncbi:hypothetical protein Cal7507_5095 [Calothrix sp. PCC 7507]|nr:hypothetical protein Cal7507_5095 [Calothrix sp. PCC 7507]
MGILPANTNREQDAPTTFKNYGSENRCGLANTNREQDAPTTFKNYDSENRCGLVALHISDNQER